MSLRIKVIDGTGADVHLCNRCSNATRRIMSGRETQSCEAQQPPLSITGKVTDCNRFNSHTDEAVSMTLKPQAWIICNDGDTLTWQTPGRTIIPFKGEKQNEETSNPRHIGYRISRRR